MRFVAPGLYPAILGSTPSGRIKSIITAIFFLIENVENMLCICGYIRIGIGASLRS